MTRLPAALFVCLSLLPSSAPAQESGPARLSEASADLHHLAQRLTGLERTPTGERFDREMRQLDASLSDLALELSRMDENGSSALSDQVRHLRQRLLRLQQVGTLSAPGGERRGSVFGDASRSSSGPRTIAPADSCLQAPTVGLGTYDIESDASFSVDGSSTCSSGADDVWYRFVAPDSDLYQVSSTPLWSPVSVHTGCPGNPANQIGCQNSHDRRLPVPVQLEAGETVWIRQDIDEYYSVTVRIERATGLSGRVVDLQGQPLSAEVSVEGATATSGSAYTTTDEDGRYLLLGLNPGQYHLRAYASGHVAEAWDDTPCSDYLGCYGGEIVTVGPGQVVDGLDFDLGPGASVSGRLTRVWSGRPWDGRIDLYDAEGLQVSRAYAYAWDDGRWQADLVPPGRLYAVASTGDLEPVLWDGISCPYQDCDVTTGTPIPTEHGSEITGVDFALDDSGTCIADDATLCLPGQSLYDGRFRVTTHVQSALGGGLDLDAQPVHAQGVDRGALFTFFDPTNPEILVKVLDGCGVNGHYWVFYAAATSLGFDLRVEDVFTGRVKTYTNPDQTPAATVTDTAALPCG